MTHQGSSPSSDRVTSADPVSALSAIGSAIFPKSVIRPRRRASSPSSRSVSEATPKTTKAAIRQPAPGWTSRTTNTGTSTSRSTVSPLATFSTLGAAIAAGTAPPPAPVLLAAPLPGPVPGKLTGCLPEPVPGRAGRPRPGRSDPLLPTQ